MISNAKKPDLFVSDQIINDDMLMLEVNQFIDTIIFDAQIMAEKKIQDRDVSNIIFFRRIILNFKIKKLLNYIYRN